MTYTGRTKPTRATGTYLVLFAGLAAISLLIPMGTADATDPYLESEAAVETPHVFGCHTLDQSLGVCIHPRGDLAADHRTPMQAEVGCHQTLDWREPDPRDLEVWLDWAYGKSASFVQECVDRPYTR